MSDQPKSQNERISLIESIKTPLGFFVLVVLIVELILGTLLTTSHGTVKLITLIGMLFILIAVTIIVAYIAYQRPEALFGNRPQIDKNSLSSEYMRFCKKISGHWLNTGANIGTVGFVHVIFDKSFGLVMIKGRSFNVNGEPAAVWESKASCIYLQAKKLYYYWDGYHVSKPNEKSEGFGEVSFLETSGTYNNANGIFSDTNFTNLTSTTKKMSRWKRCTEKEEKILSEGSGAEIGYLVKEKLNIKNSTNKKPRK